MIDWTLQARRLKNEGLLVLRALWQSLVTLPASGALDRAAAIAYYAVLAVFPFVLILVMVGGHFLQNPALATQAIGFLSERIPVAGDFLNNHLDSLQQAAGGLGLISGIGLFWSAMGLFAALRSGMDAMSGTPPRSFLKGHWASLLSVLLSAVGLMVLIFLSTLASMLASFDPVRFLTGIFGDLRALHWAQELIPRILFIQTVSLLSSEAISCVAFYFLLRMLPTARPAFRDCVVPAIVVTLAEHGFRALFVRFLLTRSDLNPIHGPLSAAIGFLGWAYASSLLVLWASLWIHHIRNLRRLHA